MSTMSTTKGRGNGAAKLDTKRTVTFEWVYPDEDGSSAAATVDLNTGIVTPVGALPDELPHSEIRTRIWSGADTFEGDMFDVLFRENDAGHGYWTVYKRELKALRQSCETETSE